MALIHKHLQFETHPDEHPSAAATPAGLARLALNDHGVIQASCRNCEQVFGYRQHELMGRHVSTLLPQLENTQLVLDDRINTHLAFLSHCAIPFKARHRDGSSIATELYINRLGRHHVVLLVRSLEALL